MARGRVKQYGHLEREWIQLYENEGLTFSAIGQMYHVQTETVSKYIKEKIKKRTRSPFSEKEIGKWVRAYRRGKTFAEIARKHKVSETTVKTNVYKEIQPAIQELKRTWVSLYKKGKCLNTIGSDFHFHPKIVLNTIKDEVDLVTQNPQNVYEPFIQEWVNLYNQGLSFQYIAKKYDVSANTVYRNIKDHVTVRSKKTSTGTIKKMVPKWKQLYFENGKTLQEISQCYEVSVSTISKYLKEK
ncbi:hypothetical protein JCM9140_2600 [Halalkalibacter wakoensis JCM 9140]|uniref:Resolvase HTH domain-containing protein n=1 Tax=Halalkalibacter wakoensis JCM 9140 TaxID=1236970 RepID=W4Q3H1_9BACI|nr:hypothetical protein [Halalkalibacter wakoensis]GAE26522.1 hypothetical protein JCM9140_2600 [Halalkalibacter wakoensis JCM 9140]